jgi:membrane protease YdiL (CAAX protease family)
MRVRLDIVCTLVRSLRQSSIVEVGTVDVIPTPATSEPRRESKVWWRSIYITSPVVMLIAVAPYTRLTLHFDRAFRELGIHDNLWQIRQVAGFSIQVALLVVIVLFWEQRPLASVGVHPPNEIDLGWGIAAFAIIEVGYIFWSAATLPLLSVEATRTQLAAWASQSEPWKIILAICGSVFEETYFRGYVIERVEEITGSMNIGVFLGTAVDLYIHSVYWDTSVVISIAFVEVSLALLYLWRRSTVSCVIAHFLMDALT